MPLLRPGDDFPTIGITPVDAPELLLPDALHGRFGIVLFYRGAWCPYCAAQLTAFQRSVGRLEAMGATVAGLSVDDMVTTSRFVQHHGLTFPVGHSADADLISQRTGAVLNPDPKYIQPTGFLLTPTGEIVVSVYSSGAIGRLVSEDVLGLLKYMRHHTPAA